MKRVVKQLWKDQSGATAIEYALIVGLMAAVLVVALGVFGDKLKDLFNAISDKLQQATDEVQNSGTGGGNP